MSIDSYFSNKPEETPKPKFEPEPEETPKPKFEPSPEEKPKPNPVRQPKTTPKFEPRARRNPETKVQLERVGGGTWGKESGEEIGVVRGSGRDESLGSR